MTIGYFVLKLFRWDKVRVQVFDFELSLDSAPEIPGIGCIPIFSSLKELKETYPDISDNLIYKIEIVDKDPRQEIKNFDESNRNLTENEYIIKMIDAYVECAVRSGKDSEDGIKYRETIISLLDKIK